MVCHVEKPPKTDLIISATVNTAVCLPLSMIIRRIVLDHTLEVGNLFSLAGEEYYLPIASGIVAFAITSLPIIMIIRKTKGDKDNAIDSL
jgi:hypothetical protein